MRLTSNQISRAKQLGLTRAIITASDTEYQRKARELRAENQRRADYACGACSAAIGAHTRDADCAK